MKRLLALLLLAAVTALGLSACASRGGDETSKAEEAEHATASGIAKGHALVQQKQYDEAIDTFVQLAGEDGVRNEAVSGAGEALVHQASTQRVPERIEAAIALGKRLPAGGAARTRLKKDIAKVLVDPVLEQVRQAEVLLKNRRAFVERMREEGEGDVMPTPRDRRVLTEAEVVAARKRLPALELGQDIAKLYRYAGPLAEAMDRFLADDERYLGEEDVTDEQLDEIEQSCDALGEALWPVQRQLDRVRPDWRRE